MKIPFAVFALGAAATACASTSSYGSMVEEARSAEPAREAIAADERALEAPRLDRASYVRAVLDRNPTLAAARAAWRAALAHVRAAGALDDPTVSLSIAPLSIGATNVPFGWEGSISQRFPWPEKLTLDVDIAKADALAAEADFDSVKLDLAVTAAALYDAYFLATRSLEINAEHVTLVRDLKDAALSMLQAGRGSTQDALQADLELAHIEHEAVVLGTDRDVVIAQMNELLHRDPDASLPPPAKEMAAPASRPAADASRRAEIVAAAARVHAGDERVRRARREWFPDLTIMTSYSSMWAMPEHRWMIGLSFDLPVEPAKREGGIDLATAERDRAASELERLTDKTRTEIAVAEKRRREAEHVLELYETRLLPIARDNVKAARAGLMASKNDFATVITAERALRNVELGAEAARADLDRRAAELARARGVLP